jgi:hypothetical protein
MSKMGAFILDQETELINNQKQKTMSEYSTDPMEEMNEMQFDIQVMKDSTLPTLQKYLDFIEWAVMEGNELDPLEAFATIKKMGKMFDKTKVVIESEAIAEAEKVGTKSFTKAGIKFEMREGAKSFDFSGIAEIEQLENQLKQAKEKYKLAYFNNEQGIMSVSEDGEVLQLPTVKYNKSSLIVK